MKYFKLLIIDDNKIIHTVSKKALQYLNEPIEILSAYNSKEALDILETENIKIAFIDYKLRNESGFSLLKKLIPLYPKIHFIMISGNKNTKIIVQSIKIGASDFLVKPIDYSILKLEILKIYKSSIYKPIYKSTLIKNPALKLIIGQSPFIVNLFKKIQKISISNVPIFIYGETGTGKELVAKAIHMTSKRKNNPFIAVNCGAFPKELIESELFGHEKGAFTGAISRKIGYFEQAHQGTLFLDEIGDLDIDLQVKFLRVLQEKEISRIGSQKKIKIDIRIISATHRNLEDYIEKKLFREDLFFRLNVIPINLIPLRKRKEDIPLLANFFLEKINKKYLLKKTLSERAYQDLMNYPWKGNIRELENIIQRIFFLSQKNIISKIPQNMFYFKKENLNKKKEKYNTKSSYSKRIKILSLKRMEKILIQKTLNYFNFNILKTSKALKIARDTLYRKIKIYNLKEKKEKG